MNDVNMLETIVVLLSFFGLQYSLRETEIFAPLRRFLFNFDNLGPFFIKLFSCSMCLGTHAGALIYLLYCIAYGQDISFALMLIWGLASGALNFIMEIVIQKLSWEKE